jgi:cellulose synthase/poly-beta-1,6-N-acetylglucosamine synthase-like glycosyltransferase
MAETARSRNPEPDEAKAATDRLVYPALMAAIIALCIFLFAEITTFSASLDALAAKEPGESFITLSRLGASLVIVLLLKEVLVAMKGFGGLSQPAVDAPRLDLAEAPLVSVVVPAFNERTAIADTLQSISNIDYPRIEIVLVNDGSTDDTLAEAQRFAERTPNVNIKILSQPNAGKWAALNHGIRQSEGELILCVDADSNVATDALRYMVPHFSDPNVCAVSGQVQIRNQVNLLTGLQALEYLVANGSARTAQSSNGCVLIVPGPLGLFRRSALEQVSRTYFAEGGGNGTSEGTGPFSRHTFAEDFELSVMLCALGGRIVYEPKAVSRTRAPATTRALLNQRYRWLRGSMQVTSRYYSEAWGRRSTNIALRWWMALVSVGDLYVVPMAGLLLLATLVWTFIVGDLQSILVLWVLVWAIQACTAVMFIRSHGERMRLGLLAPLQGIYSAVLLTGVWTHAFLDHATSRPMKW